MKLLNRCWLIIDESTMIVSARCQWLIRVSLIFASKHGALDVKLSPFLSYISAVSTL
jgi:hypothetical protein